MRIIAILTFLLLIGQNISFGQNIEAGARYKLDNSLKFDTWDGTTCTTANIVVCAGNKIKVTRIIGDKAIVKILSTYSYTVSRSPTCNTTATEAGSYCILVSTLKNNVTIPEVLPQYGFLTVPFKYDLSNSRMYPGGQIGGFLGAQKRLNWTPTESMSAFLVGTAGYSRIALNNTNIQNVDPLNTDFADAFTYGLATGISVNRFQFMIVKGWDNYNLNSEKKSISWLMIGFGFGFVKPPSDE